MYVLLRHPGLELVGRRHALYIPPSGRADGGRGRVDLYRGDGLTTNGSNVANCPEGGEAGWLPISRRPQLRTAQQPGCGSTGLEC